MYKIYYKRPTEKIVELKQNTKLLMQSIDGLGGNRIGYGLATEEIWY